MVATKRLPSGGQKGLIIYSDDTLLPTFSSFFVKLLYIKMSSGLLILQLFYRGESCIWTRYVRLKDAEYDMLFFVKSDKLSESDGRGQQ